MSSVADYKIAFETFGDPSNPPMVCIHGLMGDEAIFAGINREWGDHFHVIVPEIGRGIDSSNYILKTEDGQEVLWFEMAIDQVANHLREKYGDTGAVWTGPSLGGKQILEVAGRYPDLHRGSVLIDVGLGPLRTSKLFEFLEVTLPGINLNQPWEKLRPELHEKISNRTLRIFAQKHIGYTKDNPNQAFWKGRVGEFVDMIEKSKTENQMHYADKIDSPVYILKATDFSAIEDGDYEKMKGFGNFHFVEVPGSSHFMVATHKEYYRDFVIEKLRPLCA